MSSGSICDEWVGRVVDGKFTLLEWSGASPSGGFFLAELDGLPWKKAAVELVAADAEEAPALTVAWALAASLSHPHLIRLIDSGRCAIDTSFLIYAVTENPEEVLSEILPERPLTPAEAGEILVPILDVLEYLHSKGIVHGHLKPANILVVEDRVKLSSRWLFADGEPVWRSAARQVYDAPETSSEPISPSADIWSLGVTLVEALTQYPVWDRSIEGEPVVPASVPEPFRTIAQECLRTDPARRCTLSDIKARLPQVAPMAAVIKPVPPEPTPAEPFAEAPVAVRGKIRWPAILIAAFFLIAFVVAQLVTIIFRSHHVRTQPSSASETRMPASQPTLAASQPRLPANPAPRPGAPVPPDQNSTKDMAGGEVAERPMPDLLPNAVQSIRGEVDVSVRVTVDASGNVESASLDSPGPSKYFAKMSLQAAQNWKFKPAQVGGKSVASAWILQFKFTQAGTDVTPIQVSP